MNFKNFNSWHSGMVYIMLWTYKMGTSKFFNFISFEHCAVERNKLKQSGTEQNKMKQKRTKQNNTKPIQNKLKQ